MKKNGQIKFFQQIKYFGQTKYLSKSIDTAHPQILWSTLGKVCRLPGGFDILVKSSCQQTNSGSKNIILRARINNSTQWYRISGLSWCFLKFAFCICSLLWGFHSLCFIVVMVVFYYFLWLFWFLLAFATGEETKHPDRLAAATNLKCEAIRLKY